MANNSPTLVMASLSDDQLKKSIVSLVTHVDEAMKKMVQSTNNAVGEMEAKLKSLGNVRINSGGANDGGSSRRTSSVEKETKARKELVMTLDQQAAALDKASGKKKGVEYMSLPSDVDKNLTYLVNVNKDVDAQMDAILKKEQALIDAKQKEAQVSEQIASAQRAANSVRGVSAYDLGIDPNISAGRQRQIESTRKASKETEYLRQQVASLLEVEEREVKSVNMTTASYSELSQHLKQLQSAYNKLGADLVKKGEGVDIANEIQRTQRAMQKLQQTMSRPVSLKDALGGSEKTLDDLAYKMRRLQSYRGGLNFKTQSDEVSRVNQKYAELQKKMDVIMERNQRMIASNNALGRSWNYMKNRLAFYVTVGASTSFIKNLIEVRSQYEMNEKALGILLDSASRGTRIFNELSQMALVSPYTLIELSNAAKQLTAYDIAAKDVVDTTRRLADMASAVGVPVERLTYALGQIKAYGYLNSRDARMFANAGIPLVKQLADRYSELEGKMVSTADVYDRMKKKAIDYNDVMAVINKMTDEGGKFFDFQAKMAETLKVRLANLTLAWNNMLNDMGKDNQGWFSSGLKGLTTVFKHWRELYRIISTVIVAIGAYKTASMVAGIAASRAVSSTIPAWFRLANIVRTTQGNMALLGLTMRSIPFTAWVTAIATLASYFILFNNSSDDVKQKLEDIKSAFDGVRKEVETLFADAIKTDNIGTQLTKLRDMLELAETELGVTIPIRLEDVNESNIKQKLKEAKQFVDEYINFSQTFSEAAAGTKFNELMNDFGSKARSTYTNVTESINSVVVALQELSDKGQASKRDIEILNELTSGQKEDESRIEYLQRLVSLYEELGLIGQKKVTPKISFFGSSEDNIEELEQQQENALDRLGIKNKSVFENMLKDVQGYYSSSSIAAYQFEKQVMRVAEKIDINNIPVEQRTMKLTAAINEEASQNNWNQFEKEFARQIANEKFGTTIEISDESKKAAEEDLQAWQRNIQNWAKNNGITFDVSFQTNDTEASYAKRMLQEAKDAKELWETLGRKEKQGTGSKDATTKAYNDYIERKKLAAAAGADISSLDAKSRKAASKAESELAKALKDELSTIDKVRSIYKDLTKEGMSHANAVERATRGWDETVNAINRVLQKNGLQKLDLSKFAGIENPRELVNMLQSQLNTLLKRGAKPAEIKELQTKVNTLEVDADKYDLTKITKGLNNELGKLKDEYELAVELDANPEMGNLFADWMGIDMSTLPHTAEEYAKRMTKDLNKYLAKVKSGIEIGNILALTDDDLRMFQQRVDNKELNQVWVDTIVKNTKEARNALKKENSDIAKEWDSLVQKYAEYEYKIAQVQRNANKERKAFALKYGSNAQKERALVLTTEIDAEKDQAKKQELVNKLKQLLAEIAGDDDTKLKIKVAIDKKELEDGAKVAFEEFQKSPEWIVATGDLAGLTDKALGGLISSLEEYKKKAKYLNPKQIKQLNKALIDLYKKQREGNPFKALSIAMMEAKQRVSVFEDELKDTQDELDELTKKQAETFSVDRAKKIDELIERIKDLKKAIKDELKLNQKDVVEGIGAMIAVAKQASDIFTEMFDSLGVSKEITQQIEGVFTVLDKGIQGAQTGAAIGGQYGAIIGGVIGVFTGLASVFGSGKDDITLAIERSERSVKHLEIAYKHLEVAIEEAYGAAKWGAEQAAIANKKLQLAELKRQLALERSRDSKDRDEGKINDLMGQIEDLKIEIEKSIKDITNDLLGISSVGNAAEELVSSMIDAFRKGEDYMLHYDQTFEDMINNMVMKSIVGRVIGDRLQSLWDRVDAVAKEKGEPYQKQIDALMAAKKQNEDSMETLNNSFLWGAGVDKAYFDKYGITLTDKLKQNNERIDEEIKKLQKQYSDAIAPTPEDVQSVRDDAANWRDSVKSEFEAYMELFGIKFGDSADGKQLSSLQQGIQSVTEETASAVEAYLNGMSQQAYLRNDLLTQIRDAVIGMDMDVQVATQAQMLLQLQQSYAVQMAIQGILEGWNNPSGQAVRVELVS